MAAVVAVLHGEQQSLVRVRSVRWVRSLWRVQRVQRAGGCLGLRQPLDGVVAVRRRHDDRAIERRPLAAHAQEDGRVAARPPEGVVHEEGLAPHTGGGRVEVVLLLLSEVLRRRPHAELGRRAEQVLRGGGEAA